MSRTKSPDRRHLLAAARHPARRDGVIALTLFLLPWVALLLVRGNHLDAGTMVAVISAVAAASIGLSTLWLTWAALREAKRPADQDTGLNLGQVADHLASAVADQWNAEAAIRRLNDPYPLPVSWTAADASLTDSWDSLLTLATSGAGWPLPSPPGTWATGPDDLAGKGGELVDVLAHVPTGRLVVLGEPGAGKTILMVRLVLDLLARRLGGGPVPILASVASWNPTDQDLRGWLAAQLTVEHPALGLAPPAGSKEPSQAAALLASGLILPILDGLDEIPKGVRGPAISRINDSLRPGEHIVVTCRSQQYRDVIRPEGDVEVTLRAAAAVELRPLDADAVRRYLCDDAAGPVAKTRWAPVLAVLGTDSPAGQALETPLMVGLARTIYNPRPGELAGTLRDPAELCDPALADRVAVESRLFDAFIPASYRQHPTDRWKAQDAESWLVFLACYVELKIGVSYLAWWDLQLGVPALVLLIGLAAVIGANTLVIAGIVIGAMFGAATGAEAGAVTAAVTAASCGLIFTLINIDTFRPTRIRVVVPLPRSRINWGFPSRRVVSFATLTGIVAAVAAGIVAGVGWLVPVGVLAAVLAGITGWVFGNGPAFSNSDLAASPEAVMKWDRRTAIAMGVVPSSVLAAVAGVVIWVLDSGVVGHVAIRVGFVAPLVGGIVAIGTSVSFFDTAWPFYGIARVWLALRNGLPWPLMDFLADAHRRGVLRQAGAVYQFRHIELQHRLVNRGRRQATS